MGKLFSDPKLIKILLLCIIFYMELQLGIVSKKTSLHSTSFGTPLEFLLSQKIYNIIKFIKIWTSLGILFPDVFPFIPGKNFELKLLKGIRMDPQFF